MPPNFLLVPHLVFLSLLHVALLRPIALLCLALLPTPTLLATAARAATAIARWFVVGFGWGERRCARVPRVDEARADLFVFAYVCHETSTAAEGARGGCGDVSVMDHESVAFAATSVHDLSPFSPPSTAYGGGGAASRKPSGMIRSNVLADSST